MSSAVALIVGLGNPGDQYARTRHNVGFMAVGELASRASLGAAFRQKFEGELVKGTVGGRDCVLLRPSTFMNESGRSVGAAAAFFRTLPRDIIVLHDELDLPFGDVRVKLGGGHAGHNGLRSIIDHVGTPDFVRVRMGIGRPSPSLAGDAASYVLSGFTADECPAVARMVEHAASVVLEILMNGLERTMNEANRRGETKAAAS